MLWKVSEGGVGAQLISRCSLIWMVLYFPFHVGKTFALGIKLERCRSPVQMLFGAAGAGCKHSHFHLSSSLFSSGRAAPELCCHSLRSHTNRPFLLLFLMPALSFLLCRRLHFPLKDPGGLKPASIHVIMPEGPVGTLLQPPPLVGTSVRLVETPPRASSEGMESISLVSEVFQLQLQEDLGSQRLFWPRY